MRAPYGRGFPFALVFGGLYAARGYHVVLQSVRGTFGSGGVFEPMAHEVADGADTVAWLREQPWFTGRFATIGMSYLGFTQWALLQDPPPDMATAVIMVGPHDFNESTWGTGSFAVNDFLGWSDMVSHQEDPVRARAALHQLRARRSARPPGRCWAPARPGSNPGSNTPTRPIRSGTRCGAMKPWTGCGCRCCWWAAGRTSSSAKPCSSTRTCAPAASTSRSPSARGPTPSCSPAGWASAPGSRCSGWTPTWVTRPAGGRAGCTSTSPAWTGPGPGAAPATTERALYLRPGGYLGETAPSLKGLAPATFRYDPAHPTPTTGGPLLSPNGGYRDDTRLASRDDVLAFTSATLTEDVYVYGNPVVELAHGADHPHADLFVRVSEVDAAGRSRNVTETYRRLSAAAKPQADKVIRLELDGTAHRFRAGSRIRLLIAGSWSPRYAHNLGSGEPVLTARRLTPVTHSVRYGRSRLLLPVGSRRRRGLGDGG